MDGTTIDKVVVFGKEVDLNWFCNTLNAEYAFCSNSKPHLAEILLLSQEIISTLRIKEQKSKSEATNIWHTIDQTAYGNCPNCGCDVNQFDNSMMCGRCGQPLEWKL